MKQKIQIGDWIKGERKSSHVILYSKNIFQSILPQYGVIILEFFQLDFPTRKPWLLLAAWVVEFIFYWLHNPLHRVILLSQKRIFKKHYKNLIIKEYAMTAYSYNPSSWFILQVFPQSSLLKTFLCFITSFFHCVMLSVGWRAYILFYSCH